MTTAPKDNLGVRLRSACAQWPEISVSSEELVPLVQERIAGSDDDTPLDSLKLHELVLALCCAQGDAGAIRTFESKYMPVVDEVLARLSVAPDLADDIKQQLREHLFVGNKGQPALATYSGRGGLSGWLRVVCTRWTHRAMKKRSGFSALEQQIEDLPATDDDPELKYLKSIYRAEFKRAFKAALASLTERERTILTYHSVDGLNRSQIAVIYGVHRSTVLRWINRSKEVILARTRERLLDQLRLEDSAYESIMELVRSNLNLTLRSCLGKKSDSGETDTD